MKQMKAFIDSFLKFEFESNRMRYDESISDAECKKFDSTIHNYTHTIIDVIDIGRSEGELEKYRFKELIKVNLEKVQKRSLFQIKKYESPKCGDVIKRVLKEDVIYLCYTGDSEKDEDYESMYSMIYVVAESDEGLKIVSYFFWEEDEGLEEVGDYTPSHIPKLGKLVGVEKYLAPEESSSLADYNKD
ncbi:hypothetical protein [Flavivirga jejuensis]|uniref:Uncharacterized protein n=1 Tax=Flavivirga jejuensis TaxID=870487 RepID=A0ABT8WPE0_9FLAO|nr:hypothetical protein [Flavivirga jejuensis]MDO5974844.1 hypothetical protein [Flavivirga jejuensis]